MAGLFDSLMGAGDTEEQNPQTGLLASQQRQLAFNALGNIGATLLAAGQNLMPAERARILAGLGDVPNQMMAQQLAMQRMAKDRRAEAQDAELAKLGRSPEFQQAVSQMPPELQATIPALFRAGRAREAISMVGDWRTAQARETALRSRQEAPPAGYQWAGPGQLAPIPGGPADPAQAGALAQGKQPTKIIPPGENDKLATGASTIQQIDKVLATIADPEVAQNSDRVAGWISRNVPGGDLVAQTINPSGVAMRAAIADVGSQLLAARSGMAVTEGEYRRLASLLPNPAEDPKVIKEKLTKIRDGLATSMKYQAAQYTKENGYVPHSGAAAWESAPPTAAPAAGAGPKPGAIEDGHRFKGGNPADPKNWEKVQ